MACCYTLVKQDDMPACKLCKVTERMEDVDKLDIEPDVKNSHNIVCVASVSFDRQKRQFKYTGDHASVFGKE